MSVLFSPVWRTRTPAPPTTEDSGHLQWKSPENPEKPPETPFPGNSGIETVDVQNLTPLPDPAILVCYQCRGVDFWHGQFVTICRRCHPPAPGAEVVSTTPPRTNGVPAGAPE